MNARIQRAKQIMETKGYCSQLDSNNFSVRSQTNPKNRYKTSCVIIAIFSQILYFNRIHT